MKLIRDTLLIFQRQALLLLRNPVWIFVGVFQPVMYLLLFAPLLKPALHVSSNAQAYEIFVPGLLVLLAIFGGLFQGFGLIAELRAGIIERSRVTPVSRLALLLGRSLRDVVSLISQAIIITLLAFVFDLRVFIGNLLLAYLMLALISLMTSALVRCGAGREERGRAGAADEHGGPAGAAALRNSAAADLRTGVVAGHRRLEPVLLGGERHASAVPRRSGLV